MPWPRPASALKTLNELASWMHVNGEAIHSTRPVWPYQWGSVFVSASSLKHAYYVMVPAMQPDDRTAAAVERAPTPTGGQRVGGRGRLNVSRAQSGHSLG